ncbi:MAG: MFS transporter, partial [Actinomycetota bacterium]
MADTPHDPERDDESDGREAAAAADLASTILDEEAVRRADEERRATTTELDDEQLPGVGADEIALRDGLARGGFYTFMVLLALNSLDELEGAAINVLGPDIGETFDVSDGTITFISAASVAFFVLGAGPLGYLADRLRRGPIVGVASLAFSGFVALSGLAVNAFMFFWTRFFAGISKSNTITVHATLLADAYPIGIRGRLFALNSAIGRVFAAASPVLVGGIAVLAGGDDGWRWAYLVMAVPVAALAVLAFAIPEPERGRWEKQDVLGHPVEPTDTEPADTEPPDTEPPDDEPPDDEAEQGIDQGGDRSMPDEIPISVGAAFARIWRIDTVRFMTIGLAAIGFALFPAASISNFFLEEEFDLDAFERGLAAAPTGLVIVFFLPFIGRRFDRAFRVAPDQALRIIGVLIAPIGILVPIQYAMPNVVLFVV